MTTNKLKRALAATLAALCVFCAGRLVQASPPPPYVYNGGHSDIAVNYTGGSSLILEYNFGIDATAENGSIASQQFAADQIDVRVPDTNPESTIPSGSQWSFLGAPSGSNLWLLPQTDTPGKAFFGFGTYFLDPDVWSNYVNWSMIAASGPGQISLWQSDSFGNPTPYFTTSNGIDSTDQFNELTGGHDHYNWGFTAPGVYKVMVEAQATHDADATHANPYLVTGSDVFTFLVGSQTGIPVPGDVNYDGIVNGLDISLVASHWLQTGNLIAGDANGDGIVNGLDISLIASHWLQTSAAGGGSGAALATSVPEPSALALGAIALLAMLLFRVPRQRGA